MADINEFTRIFRGEVRSGVVRRRRWSLETKGRIVGEAVAPGAVISAVARRHDLTAQQLSNWIRAARKGALALPAEFGVDFVPVVAQDPQEGAFLVGSGIEIVMGAMVVRVAAKADAHTLETVLRVMKRI